MRSISIKSESDFISIPARGFENILKLTSGYLSVNKSIEGSISFAVKSPSPIQIIETTITIGNCGNFFFVISILTSPVKNIPKA